MSAPITLPKEAKLSPEVLKIIYGSSKMGALVLAVLLFASSLIFLLLVLSPSLNGLSLSLEGVRALVRAF